MKTSELRIGNFVDIINRKGTPVHMPLGIAISIYSLEIFTVKLCERPFMQNEPKEYSANDICGVPLSESWLLRGGFIQQNFKHSDGSISKNIFIKGTIWVGRPMGWEKYNDESFIVAQKIPGGREFKFVANKKYVHELQNLFFALTDEEILFSSGA